MGNGGSKVSPAGSVKKRLWRYQRHSLPFLRFATRPTDIKRTLPLVSEHLGAPAVYLQTRQSRSSLREAYHNCSPREHHHLPDRAIIVAPRASALQFLPPQNLCAFGANTNFWGGICEQSPNLFR